MEQLNLDMRLEQYMKPVQKIFSIDVQELYHKAKELFKSKSGDIPNPHPIILHDPINELLQEESPPTLVDAIEAHMNSLARFRAEETSKGMDYALRRYDPKEGLVRTYDFASDITNVQYTINARITNPETGRGTDAIAAYFEFHPRGSENDLQYRVLSPLDQVRKVETDEYSYFERSYNKVLGVIQVKHKGEPDTAWKTLDNPMLERMKNEPKRKKTRDSLMPDASQGRMPTAPGAVPPRF